MAAAKKQVRASVRQEEVSRHITRVCAVLNLDKVLAYNFKNDCKPDSVKLNQLQNLLHDALVSTEHVQHCAIIRRQDGTVRAASVGFQLSTEQVRALLGTFDDPSSTRDQGVFFDGKQYQCVRADSNSVYAKLGSKGLALVRTRSLLLLASYGDNMFPSVCVEAVEKLAAYFREKGK